MMPLLSAFAVVALAEMGDKTQLIALTLGRRYRQPWIVMLGILVAALFNHALASAAACGKPHGWTGRSSPGSLV